MWEVKRERKGWGGRWGGTGGTMEFCEKQKKTKIVGK